MEEETKMELAVNADEARFDEAVHKIWLNKELLAPLLKRVIPEYEDCTVEEIISMIDPDIRRDVTVSDTGSLRAQDRGTEFYSRTEKLSRFDVHIKSKNPRMSDETFLVMLHIDIEIQNRYRQTDKGSGKEYPTDKRAVYYVARELCSQLSYVTHETDYGSLEKCYSVWLLVGDVPEKVQNTVSILELKKRDLIGTVPDIPENYDLMSVVFVRLGKDVPEDSVFEFVNGVNSGKIEIVDKYVDTGKKPEVRKEVRSMEGFGRMIREEGIEIGEKRGRKIGEKNGQKKLVETVNRLRNGESRESILSSGIDAGTVDLAMQIK